MPGYSMDASGQAAIAAPQPVQEDAVLYVGNLSTDVTKPILYQYFVPYGNVVFDNHRSSRHPLKLTTTRVNTEVLPSSTLLLKKMLKEQRTP